ncbi:hypothetical protein GCM10011404_19880 [Sphingomonas prati]|nr:hypothetical protein GCM10011404_19880 [Sphingomonas prati]
MRVQADTANLQRVTKKHPPPNPPPGGGRAKHYPIYSAKNASVRPSANRAASSTRRDPDVAAKP